VSRGFSSDRCCPARRGTFLIPSSPYVSRGFSSDRCCPDRATWDANEDLRRCPGDFLLIDAVRDNRHYQLSSSCLIVSRGFSSDRCCPDIFDDDRKRLSLSVQGIFF